MPTIDKILLKNNIATVILFENGNKNVLNLELRARDHVA